MLKRFSLIFLVVAAVGCKSSGHSSAAASAQGSDSTAPEQNRVASARTGKIPPLRNGMIARFDNGGVDTDDDTGSDTPDDREKRRAERMAKIDKDGDGQISPEEREAFRKEREAAITAKLDTNKDGTVSPEEREAAMKQRAETLHAKLDTDGDGKLTVAEMQNSRFASLDPAAIDTNQDGVISAEELQAGLPTRPRFQVMDGMTSHRMGMPMAPAGGTPIPAAGSGQ